MRNSRLNARSRITKVTVSFYRHFRVQTELDPAVLDKAKTPEAIRDIAEQSLSWTDIAGRMGDACEYDGAPGGVLIDLVTAENTFLADEPDSKHPMASLGGAFVEIDDKLVPASSFPTGAPEPARELELLSIANDLASLPTSAERRLNEEMVLLLDALISDARKICPQPQKPPYLDYLPLMPAISTVNALLLSAVGTGIYTARWWATEAVWPFGQTALDAISEVFGLPLAGLPILMLIFRRIEVMRRDRAEARAERLNAELVIRMH